MKKIYTFDNWLSEDVRIGPVKIQIDFLNKYTEGKWKYNKKTGLVDINGGFLCWTEGLKNLKAVKFGVVTENFNCSDNQLTSLKGAPIEVGGSFDCSDNKLDTLEGSPQKVAGDFICSNYSLKSLEGAPQEVGGDFICSTNKITSLEGAPLKIGGDIKIGDYTTSVIKMDGKDWNIQGWIKIYRNGSEKNKALISTLPAFKDFMTGHPNEFGDFSDLSDLGF